MYSMNLQPALLMESKFVCMYLMNWDNLNPWESKFPLVERQFPLVNRCLPWWIP